MGAIRVTYDVHGRAERIGNLRFQLCRQRSPAHSIGGTPLDYDQYGRVSRLGPARIRYLD